MATQARPIKEKRATFKRVYALGERRIKTLAHRAGLTEELAEQYKSNLDHDRPLTHKLHKVHHMTYTPEIRRRIGQLMARHPEEPLEWFVKELSDRKVVETSVDEFKKALKEMHKELPGLAEHKAGLKADVMLKRLEFAQEHEETDWNKVWMVDVLNFTRIDCIDHGSHQAGWIRQAVHDGDGFMEWDVNKAGLQVLQPVAHEDVESDSETTSHHGHEEEEEEPSVLSVLTVLSAKGLSSLTFLPNKWSPLDLSHAFDHVLPLLKWDPSAKTKPVTAMMLKRDPRFQSKEMKACFHRHHLEELIHWLPSHCHDITPTENVHKMLRKEVREASPINMAKLGELLRDAWDEVITPEIISLLFEDMPFRIKQLIDTDGEKLD